MKDLLTGFIFVIVGMIFAAGSLQISVGTSSSMGPGYFPLLVSSVLILIGSILILKNLWKS